MKSIFSLKKQILFIAFLPAMFFTSCVRNYKIDILSTNDIHGSVFSKDLISEENIPSLSNISYCIDSIRQEMGANNVILVDCGDHLQGTPVTYYYNYVDTSADGHLVSRIFNYMKYDALVVGNHDIEAGPDLYNKIKEESDCPYLAANVIKTEDGSPYFDRYTIVKRNGLKIAIIGFTNANVKSWVSPDKYAGLNIVPIYPLAQEIVNEVRKKEKPHLVLLAVHSGLGDQDKDDIENNALFLASNVKGIDAVLLAHDHQFFSGMISNGFDSVAAVEGGAHSKGFSKLEVEISVRGNKVISKKIVPSFIKTDNMPYDQNYDEYFEEDYKTVRKFCTDTIGKLVKDLDLSYVADRSDPYMSLIHYVQLNQPEVQISINAPLANRGFMKARELLYNDLFTLYRFENLLYVVKMSGSEIKNFLEAAYDKRITKSDYIYNYDTAAGLNYIVKSSAPKGKRVSIKSMADGEKFDENALYNVAITSYRASGAGNLLKEAGIDLATVQSRLIAVYPEIRNLIYNFIVAQKEIDPEKIASDKSLGSWKIIK